VEPQTALLEWEPPEFEEVGCGPEATMYVATMDD
jgi:coenzyme PQQ precursor peptide PqqA